jgi:hypothetical protein
MDVGKEPGRSFYIVGYRRDKALPCLCNKFPFTGYWLFMAFRAEILQFVE